MRNKIIITGGAGFVGTNLIKLLLKKTKYKILSLDNYSSGKKTNHIKNSRIEYVNGKTANIAKLIKKPKEINSTQFNPSQFNPSQFNPVQINSNDDLANVLMRFIPNKTI